MPSSRAAVLRAEGGPFEIEDVLIEPPRPTEVLVRVVATGLCHTDLLARDQVLPPGPPAVLGHEGSGVVEAVGAGVRSVAVGDPVVLAPASCGRCVNCLGAHPMQCRTFLGLNLRGRRPDGSTAYRGADGTELGGHFFGQSSFSGLVVADERSVVRVRPDAPLDLLGPLGCGLQTGAGAVFNVLEPRPASSIAVFGAGAVGLAAVMAAAVAGCRDIVVVDLHPGRLALAAELGATAGYDAADDDVVKQITEATGGGVDHAVDAVGLPQTVRSAVDVLNVGGSAAVVGSAGTGREVSLDISRLFGRTVTGVVEGDSVPGILIPQLVDLFLAGRFPLDKLITRYGLAQVNEAAADAAAGRVVKPVLTH
ncbi:NAD(P)-dependent alcohol dehydrogenase [Catellatospora coxensis]|uniref:Aryl-alcohol dehydrogenase n=1 Tax=Catellatospora coxensis TaxID=310354 RepID=A0A8J3L4H7_9ACTN|nr:NAD(P)-dependent alcohol dehydrogenase [Catellatospora coxensis]GIG06390.1 aryl-alcohol dehydrogenase [Catellatospora coxensis]